MDMLLLEIFIIINCVYAYTEDGAYIFYLFREASFEQSYCSWERFTRKPHIGPGGLPKACHE